MPIKKQVLIVFTVCSCLFAGVSAASAAQLSSAEAGLLSAVNQARAAHGLRPVRVDATLERAARAHSSEMLNRGSFTHGAFAQRMLAFGTRGSFMGENLAWGSGALASPGSVIGLWLASPAHRANLLRPGFERIGIGALRGSFLGAGDALVVTADFGGR